VMELPPLMGLYNVVVTGAPSLVDGGEVLDPQGYLSLSVGNAGVVKLAGALADGAKVSGSAKLLKGLNADGWYAIALHRPLYSKKGFIGGLLWLDPSSRVIRVDAGDDWLVDWVSQDPKTRPFARRLDVFGGYFGTGKNTPTVPWGLRFSANVPEALPPPVVLTNGRWVNEAFPWDIPVITSGLKLSLPKATPSGATLSYTAKTGIFKGKFSLYYDGTDAKGKLQHKATGVSYSGAMVPDGGSFTGFGTGAATINKQKVGMGVWLEK